MAFQHEALIYEGREGFLAGAIPFIQDGLQQGEPVLVAVRGERIGPIEAALGADVEAVTFTDMAGVGANPSRIIPAWREFVDEHGGRPARGIGEPVWEGRDADELVECQLHEALLNVAFADEDLRLLCPYDARLGAAVIREALCSHPHISTEAGVRPSRDYRAGRLLGPFEAPLPPPPGHTEVLGFDRDGLAELRRTVAAAAQRAGFRRERAHDLVLVTHELAGNSVRHGAGHGVLRIWTEDDAVVCEVRDRGRLRDPLAGRRRPHPEATSGWGLWLANQLCDLVQLRSGPDGTVVRARMRAA